MTKEELAKKKGIKMPTETQSPSDALVTTKEEPKKKTANNAKPKEVSAPKDTSKNKTASSSKPVAEKKETMKPASKPVSKPTSKKKEVKAGRPKGPESTKISMNIPNESLDLIGIAAGINYKGNISSYINALIEKDLAENGKVYKQIKAMADRK